MSANDGFNGTTVTFASSSVGDLRGVRYREGGADADITPSNATAKIYVGGIPDKEVTLDGVGTSPITVVKGQSGALAINWNDSTVDSIPLVECSNIEQGGQMDGEITWSLSFKPTA